MDKKKSKTSKANRNRSKNRCFNTVLYIVAGILMLVGIFTILNDTTLLFAGCFISSGEDSPAAMGSMPPLPTFPPTSNPGSTSVPATYKPRPIEFTTELPETSPSPSPTPAVEWHPDPGFTHDSQPDDPVAVIFPQYAVEGVGIKYYKNGAPEGKSIICPVEPVGLNGKGQMDTVRHWAKAGWFYAGGTPVKGGNTIIAGHNKYRGHLGYFSIIKDKMQPGDQVIVQMRNGEYAFYYVEAIEIWRYDEVPDYVMQTYGESRLTLITCKGDYSGQLGTSRHRVIAICKPAGSPEP